jgi:hypothetical protein
MRDVAAELKALRLHGMVAAWEEIVAQGNSAGLESSRWLIEHLLDAEHTDRHALDQEPDACGQVPIAS